MSKITDRDIGLPWIEKYRPNSFENIVLCENNKTIFQNIT